MKVEKKIINKKKMKNLKYNKEKIQKMKIKMIHLY